MRKAVNAESNKNAILFPGLFAMSKKYENNLQLSFTLKSLVSSYENRYCTYICVMYFHC